MASGPCSNRHRHLRVIPEELMSPRGDCQYTPAVQTGHAPRRPRRAPRPMAFALYLLFIVSYFLHLTARIPALGAIRFDLILTALVFWAIILRPPRKRKQPDYGHIRDRKSTRLNSSHM